MTSKATLQADLSAAMRAGDTQRRDVLRMMLAAVQQAEVDSRTQLDEAAVEDVLRKQVKQRQESIADYEKAGRQEEVAREQAEIAIIEPYLPQMMSRDEIALLAEQVIVELGVSDPKSMGQVMGKLMPLLKGQADGRVVNEVVRELLQ